MTVRADPRPLKIIKRSTHGRLACSPSTFHGLIPRTDPYPKRGA